MCDLKKRWHGHSVYPFLMALRPNLEVRSNWQIYVEEFAIAAKLLGHEVDIKTDRSNTPLTRFEAKYWAHGCATYRILCTKNRVH